MRFGALGWCWLGLFSACGARTEPISVPSLSGRAPEQGGTVSATAGGVTSTAGWSASGGTSPVEVSGGSSGQGSARRWLVVQQTTNDVGKLSLLGIEDSAIERFELPQGNAVANADINWSVVFNSTGERFAYVTKSGGVSRFWVVTLGRNAFITQEVSLPASAPSGDYVIGSWFSDSLFSARLNTSLLSQTDDPSQAAPPPFISLSLDPIGLPPDDSRAAKTLSPDGAKAVLATANIGAATFTIEIRRVDNGTLAGDSLLSMREVLAWQWAPSAQYLLVSQPPFETPSVTVIQVPSAGSAKIVDQLGPLQSPLSTVLISPGGSYIAYQTSLHGQTRFHVRNLANGQTASVGNLANGQTEYGLKWIADDLLLGTGNAAASTAGFSVAAITPEAIATGTLSLRGLSDPNASAVLEGQFWLSDDTALANRCTSVRCELELITFTATDANSIALLPGLAGDATPTRVLTDFKSDGFRSFVVPANPSYYYLVFSGSNLIRSLRLTDFFGETYSLERDGGGNVGIIARNVKKPGEFAWLYLDREQPGPLATMPLELPSSHTVFYLPPAWLE